MRISWIVLSIYMGLNAHAQLGEKAYLEKTAEAAADVVRAQQYLENANKIMRQDNCDGSEKKALKECLAQKDGLLTKRTAAIARVETVSPIYFGKRNSVEPMSMSRDEMIAKMIDLQVAIVQLQTKKPGCASSVDCEMVESDRESKIADLRSALVDFNERIQFGNVAPSRPLPVAVKVEEKPAKAEKYYIEDVRPSKPAKPVHIAQSLEELIGKQITLPGMYMLEVSSCKDEPRIAYTKTQTDPFCKFVIDDVDCERDLPDLAGSRKPVKWRVIGVRDGVDLKARAGLQVNVSARKLRQRIEAKNTLEDTCSAAPWVFKSECRDTVAGMGTYSVPDGVVMVSEDGERTMTLYAYSNWNSFKCLQRNAFILELDDSADPITKVQTAADKGPSL